MGLIHTVLPEADVFMGRWHKQKMKEWGKVEKRITFNVQ